MDTNYTNNKESKLIYPELSFKIVGICFDVHNSMGRFARELQYSNAIELKLKEKGLLYVKEHVVGSSGNRVDFLIDNKIVLEIKAKPMLTKQDYYQTQRYLHSLNMRLGLLVNFRNRYLKPMRIVRIDTDVRKKYL